MNESNRATPKILVADDDPCVLRAIAARCSAMGFDVETATSGLQAVIKTGEYQPDVLIIDIHMPEVDGLSVLEYLRDIAKQPIHVMVVTGNSGREVRGILSCVGGRIVEAEALDRMQDVVCGFGPSEGLGIVIVSFDVGSDVGPERCDTAIDATADFTFSDESKEALDPIEPGRACGRQMDVPARPFGQPIADQRRLVGGVIVPDELNLKSLGDIGLDLVEKRSELGRPMTAIALSDHVTRRDVERGKERGCAMALVVMATPGGLAWPHRQHGLAAIQRLDLALLVDAKHDHMFGRRHVKSDDIAHFGDEVGIGRKLEAFHPVRLQPKACQMRCTLETERPLALAMPRELQCVAFSGRLSKVFTITASMHSSSIERGAPERASSCSPSICRATNRRRHLPTVPLATQLPGSPNPARTQERSVPASPAPAPSCAATKAASAPSAPFR